MSFFQPATRGAFIGLSLAFFASSGPLGCGEASPASGSSSRVVSGGSGSTQSSGATAAGSTSSGTRGGTSSSDSATSSAGSDTSSGNGPGSVDASDDQTALSDTSSGPTGGDAGGASTDGDGLPTEGSPGMSAPSDNVAATAANRATCMSVPLSTAASGAKVCPGGGAGPNCFECLFGGSAYNTTNVATAMATQEAGNYAVTVQIGAAAAGQTEIEAEANRAMLGPVTTSAGQSLTYQFMVDVRAKEGQPDENVAAGYPGLDLFFSGPMTSPPEVSAIGYALAGSVGDKPVMVYIASDSTACDQTDTDYAGWGQMLPQYFDYPVEIANYADSGESSGSFLGGADRWGAVDAALAKGDWVLIQFGHNDGNTSSSAFQANVTQMVTQAKAKGATPILISPPARATFTGSTLAGQGSLHGADMQAVATAQSVAYIDLTSITTTWYNQVGPTGWQAYHALGKDKTHTNAAGATKIAGLLSSAFATQKIGLSAYLRH